MKTNTLMLNLNDFPELAKFHMGQPIKFKAEGIVRMKHLENTEEYAEILVEKLTPEGEKRPSVQDVLLASIAQNTGTPEVRM